ncbi:unnamed protein product, partial [Nesidiocoris tenuis]
RKFDNSKARRRNENQGLPSIMHLPGRDTGYFGGSCRQNAAGSGAVDAYKSPT